MGGYDGKTVLITGGARGIGFCTAEQFARAGARLILTDIDPASLQEAAQALRGHGATVETHVVDVTDRAQVDALARGVLDAHGVLDVLINNAGIGYSAELVETSLDTWRTLMDVNFWGPLYHVYAFLPSMTRRRSGHIVNVSSGQAFFRLPTWGAYATIKLATGAFSEILRFELRKFDVRVTTVYPFMVNTRFYAGEEERKDVSYGHKLSMKLLPYYSMTPEKVGRIIFNAVRRGKSVERVSFLNTVGEYTRFVPGLSSLVSWGALQFLGKPPEKLKLP